MTGQPMTASTALRTKLAQAFPTLRKAAGGLWSGSGLERRYPEYLRTMHGVIRASVPLMELAARRCAAHRADAPIAGPLHDYLEKHIVEERGHDDWLLADLASLGCDPVRVLATPPVPAVARLVGPQYYWIEHHHPVALLGYIAVLEGNAPATGLVDRIMADLRLPASAVRTVREHAALDGQHTDEVYALIDGLPLTPAQAYAVAVSGLSTVDALVGLFAHIVAAAPPDLNGDLG
jgi:hypothetical protein